MLRGLLRHARAYATVGSATLIAKPPSSPTNLHTPSVLDNLILSAVRKHKSSPPNVAIDISTLVDHYDDHGGTVLPISLPYESRPPPGHRVDFESTERNVALVAHCIRNGEDYKITVSSGFRLNTNSPDPLFVTCAHTLVEIYNSPLFARTFSSATAEQSPNVASGTFIVTRHHDDDLTIHPVSSLSSALHRSDLLVLSTSKGSEQLKALPLSPYPAHPQTAVRAHFVTHHPPDEPGWTPWIGGAWSKWVRGKVLGYRDFAGRETQPGTYDALSHLLFHPPPTAGSSGGPIVDEESGAVVGIMLGSRMDNHIEGVRGWGVPSETVFEMFQLPGLEGKN